VHVDDAQGVARVGIDTIEGEQEVPLVTFAGLGMTAASAELLAGLLVEAARIVHAAHGGQPATGGVVPLRADLRQEIAIDVLAVWRRDMTMQGLSDRTINSRLALVTHAAGGQDPVFLDSEHVAEYLARPGLSVGSRGTYAAALRAWFAWLQRTGQRADNPMDALSRPKVPAGEPRPAETAAIRAVLASDLWPSTRAMILLGAYQGLRVSEIAAVRAEDVDVEAGKLWVVGKGGRRASVLLHPAVAEIAGRMPESGLWFPSPADASRHVDRSSVSAVISRAFQRAGYRFTAHQLRHWFASQLLRSGATVREVQVQMRHTSLQHTARYMAVDEDHARQALAGLPAL
jgi:integrase/recombinase XerD